MSVLFDVFDENWFLTWNSSLISLSTSHHQCLKPIAPTHVLITEEFGFVCLIAKTQFILLTSNGECVKTANVDFGNVARFFRFSTNGVDYIVFHTEKTTAYFEAFYPEDSSI